MGVSVDDWACQAFQQSLHDPFDDSSHAEQLAAALPW
jgi:hypothetical protein